MSHNLATTYQVQTYDMLALNRALDQLNRALKAHGLPQNDPTPEAVLRYQQKQANERADILNGITVYTDILINSIYRQQMNPELPLQEMEFLRMRQAAEEFHLRILDDNLHNYIEEDDVVEIYDSQDRQIYRNLRYCQLCSYSLLDVAVHNWQELYDRPKLVIERIVARATEIIVTNSLTRPFQIPRHILREKLIYSQTLRTFLINLKYVSPIMDLKTGKRVGFICIGTAEKIHEVNNTSILNPRSNFT